jgi:hypothetical protein
MGAVPAPRQRHALGALFLVLTLAFAGIATVSAAGAGASVGRWIVAAAAAAIAAWFVTLAWQLLVAGKRARWTRSRGRD